MEEDLKRACQVLRKGGVIIYPTDTIWGIGCDATSENAVKRVYEIKRRSDAKSLLVLMDSLSYLSHYVGDLPEIAFDLIDCSDKPLTVIYSGAKNLAPNLTPDGTVGVRITNEEFSRELCRQFRKPVVSTSANFSGEPSPSNFSEINPELLRLVDYVVKYRSGETQKSKPSSIIRLEKDGVIKILRE